MSFCISKLRTPGSEPVLQLIFIQEAKLLPDFRLVDMHSNDAGMHMDPEKIQPYVFVYKHDAY